MSKLAHSNEATMDEIERRRLIADGEDPADWTADREPVVIPEGYTPGPWRACGDGDCPCKCVMAADHPIADVTHGEWGDDYPALRLVGDSSLDMRAEAYMERITYGDVPNDVATANAKLIALAPRMAEEIVRLREALRRCLNFIENTEGELGITLESGDIARAALGDQ